MRRVFVSLTIPWMCLASFVQARQLSAPVAYVIDAATTLPVEGAALQVIAVGQASSGPHAAILASARTNADGGFQLPTGIHGVLEVHALGYATKRLLWPAQNLPEIFLERGAAITVNVSDDAGTPLPAVVLIRTLHPGNIVADSVRVDAGIGQFVEMPSGPATIVARSEGFAPAALGLQIAPGRRYGPLQLTLSRAASVRGVILDAAGLRRPEATLVVDYTEVPFGNELGNLVARRKAPDADFELRNLVPGVGMQIYAEHEGRRSPILSLVLAPGEERVGAVLILN